MLGSIYHLTQADLLVAKRAQERFEIETEPDRLAQHDTDFHLALYAKCENRVLLDLISHPRRLNRRAYLGQPLGSATRDLCIQAHWQLLDAVTQIDSDRAIAVLQEHFEHAKERDE